MYKIAVRRRAFALSSSIVVGIVVAAAERTEVILKPWLL
jgi:hypothetical protein